MIIAFCGHSGSGKTTIIYCIKKRFLLSKKRVSVGMEDHFLTVRLAKFLLGNEIFSKYKKKKFYRNPIPAQNISDKIFSFTARFFYPFILYVDFLTEYIYYEVIFKEKILLRDRYIYDYIVTYENILGTQNTFIKHLFTHFPKPYLLFYIKINIATAMKRNKNTAEGRLEGEKLFHQRIIDSYNSMATESGWITIENDRTLNISIEKISHFIDFKKQLAKIKKIAIIGLDGAGKTTLVQLLSEYINQFNIKSKIVHFYHENLLYKLLIRLGFYKVLKMDKGSYAKNRKYASKHKNASFIMAFLRFVDSYIQFLFSITYWSNRVIIFDRYFYDYLVSFEYLNVKWRSVFAKLIPSVDRVFLLISRPQIYYRRKPENTRDFFVQNHQIYKRLGKIYTVKIINTTYKTPKNILNEAIKAMI